jgi:hypothetical protein
MSSHNDIDGVTIRNCTFAEGNKFLQNVQILGGTITLASNAASMQFLDANGAVRTVNLPSNSLKGKYIKIFNPAGAAFGLTVKDNTSTTTVATVAQGKAAEFWCNGDGTVNAWKVFAGA